MTIVSFSLSLSQHCRRTLRQKATASAYIYIYNHSIQVNDQDFLIGQIVIQAEMSKHTKIKLNK